MDRAGADFLRCRNKLKIVLVRTLFPINSTLVRKKKFKGVIDLIKMKAINWNEADPGHDFTYEDIPADMVDLPKNGVTTGGSRRRSQTKS